jgi:hypothetical protein
MPQFLEHLLSGEASLPCGHSLPSLQRHSTLDFVPLPRFTPAVLPHNHTPTTTHIAPQLTGPHRGPWMFNNTLEDSMRTSHARLFIAGMIALAALIFLAGPQPAIAGGSRYLVSEGHTKEECVKTLDEAKETGGNFLAKCDWGCMAGDHTGYVILEAKDDAALKKMLPASWKNAKIVKLNKFTAEQIASFHKK